MPRFSQDERRILIEMAETFEATTADPKIKGHLRQIIRKTRESDKHHERMSQQNAGRKS